MPGVDKQSPEFFKSLDSIRAHSSIYQGIERVRSRYAGTWKGEALFYAALAEYYEEEAEEARAWENKRESRIEELEDNLAKALGQRKVLSDALDCVVDFASTVAGGASFWDDVFDEHQKKLNHEGL